MTPENHKRKALATSDRSRLDGGCIYDASPCRSVANGHAVRQSTVTLHEMGDFYRLKYIAKIYASAQDAADKKRLFVTYLWNGFDEELEHKYLIFSV